MPSWPTWSTGWPAEVSQGLLAVALGAGMLAAVNPCGFALLPAYLSLLIAGDQPPTRTRAVARALGLTGSMTLGFALVFALFGLAVAPVASGLQQHLPWFTVVLGLALVVLGLMLLAGRSITLPRWGRSKGGRPLTRSFTSMAGFGASYAVASLSCTIAPFLAVVVGGFRASSILEGIALFLAYAAGMGLVVGTVAVATALASGTLVGHLRRAGAWTPRAAGLLLALSGAYVGYYGWWELRVLSGADASDPVIDQATSVQQTLAGLVAAPGPVGWLLAGTVLVLVAVVAGRVRRRST